MAPGSMVLLHIATSTITTTTTSVEPSRPCTAPGSMVLLHITTSTTSTSAFILLLLPLLLVLQVLVPLVVQFFGTGYVFQHIWKRRYHMNTSIDSCIDVLIEVYLHFFFPQGSW